MVCFEITHYSEGNHVGNKKHLNQVHQLLGLLKKMILRQLFRCLY